MISSFGLTDVGRRRTVNEDAIYADDTLFVVCDGTGGPNAGDKASRLAIDTIAAFVKRSATDADITWPFGIDKTLSLDGNRLQTGIKLANATILGQAPSSEDNTGMGTTVVATLVSPTRPRMAFVGVGDSRIYRIRAGAILQLTQDESWANLDWKGKLRDDGDTARTFFITTKVLGAREHVDFEVKEHDVRDGDVFLLCSDGLTTMVPDSRLLEIVSMQGADLERPCGALIDAANTAGGRDNISAILVRHNV